MIYELVEKKISNRGNVFPLAEIKTHSRDYECYVSMFGFDKSIIDHIKVNKTVKGYKGKYHLRTLWFDIDAELLEAQKSAIELVQKFVSFNVPVDQIYIYFSGGKGFHIGLDAKFFGGFDPSEDLPEKIKLLAEKLSVQNCDVSIYNKNRILRFPNSKHKSGYYKVPLTFDELQEDITIIQTLAENPRVIEFNRDFVKNNQLIQMFDTCFIEQVTFEPTQSVYSFNPPPEGNRNNILFWQAKKLVDVGLKKRHIIEIVQTMNRGTSHPLSNDEIMNLLGSAFRGLSEHKYNGLLYSDMIDDYIRSISPGRKKITLCFDQIDLDTKERLLGDLIVIAGQRGTKKSIYGQQILHTNAIAYGHRCIYSSMEMGTVPVFTRGVDMLCHYNEQTSLTRHLEKQSLEEARRILEKKVTPVMGDKMIVCTEGSMIAERYSKFIDETEQKYGKVDLLLIDGLSMTGGSGSESERFEKNTREFKELAIKHDILVLLICHVRKDISPDTRDLEMGIRGSGKIMDNADSAIYLSRLKGIDDKWRNDYQFLRFFNKRYTGNQLDLILNFDPTGMKLRETNYTFEEFDVKQPDAKIEKQIIKNPEDLQELPF